MSLKSRAFSAVRWTTLAAIAKGLLQVAQIAVLARLLNPEDYGLMAMVSVVLTFSGLFADFGMSSAYVQRQAITQEQRSSLFWLNVAMGAILTAFVFSLSSQFASFFGDDRLAPLLMLSSVTIFLASLGRQVHMSAEKSLNFRPVVLLEIVSGLLGFCTAIISAVNGLGVYALVWGSIVTAGVSSLLAWILIAKDWRPLARFRFRDVRPFLGFGGAIVGNSIVNRINMSIDLVLGGKFLLATQLGIYSVPRQIILQLQFLANPIVTRVGFPLIAHVQSDLSRVKSIYLKTMNMTASINAPIYCGLAFFGPDVVRLLLGENWSGSGDLLRVLAIWGFFRSIGNPAGSLLFGVGRADLALKWNLAMLGVLPPLVMAGTTYGAMGMAWALLGFSVIMFVPGWYVLVYSICRAELAEYVRASLKPGFIALGAIFPTYWLLIGIEHYVLRVTIATLVAVPLYLVMSYRFNYEWFRALIELLGKGRTAEQPTAVP